MRIFWFIALIAVVAGCGSQTDGRPRSTNRDVALDKAEVLLIARQAVAANDTWLDQAEFEIPKKRTDGSWSVMVWRLPKTPGGHRYIIIDSKGVVTDYKRGL